MRDSHSYCCANIGTYCCANIDTYCDTYQSTLRSWSIRQWP
jgi:hypothetical protein